MAADQQGGAARSYGEGWEYVAMGFSFAAAILLFGAAGWWVDGRLHTRPLFAVLLSFLGGFLGFMRIYWRVTRTSGKDGTGQGAK